MLRSMTGFASKSLDILGPSGDSLSLTLSLKSLNARFFETICKLPFALTNLEIEIIRRLKKKLRRGTVFITVSIHNPGYLKGNLSFSKNVVGNYLRVLKEMKKEFDLPGKVELTDIMRLPNVFEFPERLVDSNIGDEVLRVFENLADEVIKVGFAEGGSLQKDFLSRIEKMKQKLAMIKSRTESVGEQRREKLLSNLESVITEESDQSRDLKLQVLQSQLDRHQIDEEIVRIETHLENLALIIKDEELEKGRRVDFTVQELFREVNTLTSKAGDVALSNFAIDLKISLEKIKEQNQNIV